MSLHERFILEKLFFQTKFVFLTFFVHNDFVMMSCSDEMTYGDVSSTDTRELQNRGCNTRKGKNPG